MSKLSVVVHVDVLWELLVDGERGNTEAEASGPQVSPRFIKNDL